MFGSIPLDHYEWLGVPRAASVGAIRKAYHRRMRQWHPDRNPGRNTTRECQALNAAYECLKNPARRAIYDAFLAAAPTRPKPSPAPAPALPRASSWRARAYDIADAIGAMNDWAASFLLAVMIYTPLVIAAAMIEFVRWIIS